VGVQVCYPEYAEAWEEREYYQYREYGRRSRVCRSSDCLYIHIVDSVLMLDTASKGAVLALSRELAIVHAKDGIRVNALCPGPLNTPLLQNFLDTPEKRFRRTIHLPTGRFGIDPHLRMANVQARQSNRLMPRSFSPATRAATSLPPYSSHKTFLMVRTLWSMVGFLRRMSQHKETHLQLRKISILKDTHCLRCGQDIGSSISQHCLFFN
jgi:Enoyl-(Acyl carrier protein) reductase